MRVFLFAPYALYSPHFETDLEIAENHLEHGDRVTLLTCNRDLEICDPNVERTGPRCLKCMERSKAGIRRLSGTVEIRGIPELLTAEDHRRVAEIPTRFEDARSLRALTVDGFDVGFAALSSLIWRRQDPDLDLQAHSADVARFLRSSLRAYYAVRNYLRDNPTDRAYVFNGRMAPMRAAFRACQREGVDCFVHERGCDLQHYALFRNAMPHEIANTERLIREAWVSEDVPRAEKIRIAENWFEQRSRGVVNNWHSFTAKQVRGRLPEDWRDDRRNIAVYATSEYEFAAISDEWNNPIFDSPTEGLRRIVDACAAHADDVHVYLRLHPAIAAEENPSVERLLALRGPHVTVLPPDSNVCSYALLDACEKVVVTSSTLGIEAAFRGKPSILAGRCFYRNLGSTYLPADFEELMALILDPHLAPRQIEGALMYGYYQATFGTEFRHFRPTGVCRGEFKGRPVKPSPLGRLRVGSARVLGRG